VAGCGDLDYDQTVGLALAELDRVVSNRTYI